MRRPYFDDGAEIGPQELHLLHEVMVELCRDQQIETKSAEGAALASVLVGLYKSGFRSRQELLFMAGE